MLKRLLMEPIESSDEIYIICAHYDTVSSSPGADDDTSGTVAVLMAAFIMSQYHYQFNHTIKFVVFSGEEQGLLGSKAYAVDAAEEEWNIVGVLNADMISYAKTTSDGDNLIVFENIASEWLYNYTLDISTEYADYIHLTLYQGGPLGAVTIIISGMRDTTHCSILNILKHRITIPLMTRLLILTRRMQ